MALPVTISGVNPGPGGLPILLGGPVPIPDPLTISVLNVGTINDSVIQWPGIGNIQVVSGEINVGGVGQLHLAGSVGVTVDSDMTVSGLLRAITISGLISSSLSITSRSLGTVWTASNTRLTWVGCTLEIATGVGGDGEILLVVGGVKVASLRVGTALTTLRGQLSCMVPRDKTVLLTSSTALGTPTYTIITVSEVIVG